MTGAALADVEPKRCEDSRWGHKSCPLPLWPCPSGQLRNSWRIPPMTDWASMISRKAIPLTHIMAQEVVNAGAPPLSRL